MTLRIQAQTLSKPPKTSARKTGTKSIAGCARKSLRPMISGDCVRMYRCHRERDWRPLLGCPVRGTDLAWHDEIHCRFQPESLSTELLFGRAGDFALRQSDFGIALVSAAAGTIRVKDEVKCTFDILARRQE